MAYPPPASFTSRAVPPPPGGQPAQYPHPPGGGYPPPPGAAPYGQAPPMPYGQAQQAPYGQPPQAYNQGYPPPPTQGAPGVTAYPPAGSYAPPAQTAYGAPAAGYHAPPPGQQTYNPPPAGAPYGSAPPASPYEQPPPGRAPYGQSPPGQAPYGQAPPGQAPYGQAPPGQAPYGQAPPGQAPYGQAPPGSPYGQAPPGRAPSPYGQQPAPPSFYQPTPPAQGHSNTNHQNLPAAQGFVDAQSLGVPPLSGRKRAVLVGINYLHDKQLKLGGCINDAKCMKYLLETKFQFKSADIVLLTDDQQNTSFHPTRRNILNALGWLTGEARPGDSLFFHYSGHGSQKRDTDGDEADGMDETIIPMDYRQAGDIVDDELHKNIASKVPQGTRLTSVMDCCHSGTGLDLPHTYTLSKDGIKQAVDQRAVKRGKETKGEVVLFSGCQDNQTSADTNALSGGARTGAMTFSFIQAVEKHYPNLSYEKLLIEMSRVLRSHHMTQQPSLSSGHGMNVRMKFEV